MNKNALDLIKVNTTTGKTIKAYRENFNISQDTMAFACGLSQANLSAIENDKRDVGPKVALKIAAFMGVSPELILYPNGFENEPEYKNVIKKTKAISNL